MLRRRSIPALSLPLRYALQSAALAAVYLGAALLGLRYASIGQSVSLVWPPTGIAIAGLTLLGYRYWPSIAVGAFVANAATPVPLAAAASIALGNTLEALVVSGLLRRYAGPRPQLDNIRHVRALVLLAAPLGTLTSAAVGSLSLWSTGVIGSDALAGALAIWWTGDLLGGLVVAPLLFAWLTRRDSRQSTRRLVEVLLLCAGTALAGEVALGAVNYPYLLFPFVIWAALRFGARGATVMTFAVATVAVGHTVQGGSPFVGATAGSTLFQVACYLGVVAVTGLVLAAAVRMERDQATAALADSEERLRRALDAARMGVWVWSVETNTLTWDDNLRRLYGLQPGQPIGGYEDFLSRVHPDDRDTVNAKVRQALEEGTGLDYEFRIVLPDGRIRWIADQGEIRRDQAGRPVLLTGICTDVTDRMVAEERLRQAHRMESVGRLAGGVAHETNNQMSVVLGASDFILRRSDVPDPVRADVEFIQKAAERAAAVTAQLLAFSRQQILRMDVLDLNLVIRKWESVLRRVMGEDCGVTLRLAPEIGKIRGDPGQLEQVLLNLALNARDAMPRGGTITIETSLIELSSSYGRTKPGTAIQPGTYVLLAVSDTGHGMDRETLSHVFEPFFTTKAVGKGTGLGLSTVYGIVKQLNGYVWVYSEPEQGTVFKIYLPLVTGEAAGAQISPFPVHARSGAGILLVEDEASVRYIMRRTLEDAGYSVIEADNIEAALTMLADDRNRINLVLTDVIMPGGGGRELADRIETVHPGIPVLFTSGYTDGDIERRGLLPPGATFLQKPVTPDALLRAVGAGLDGAENNPSY